MLRAIFFSAASREHITRPTDSSRNFPLVNSPEPTKTFLSNKPSVDPRANQFSRQETKVVWSRVITRGLRAADSSLEGDQELRDKKLNVDIIGTTRSVHNLSIVVMVVGVSIGTNIHSSCNFHGSMYDEGLIEQAQKRQSQWRSFRPNTRDGICRKDLLRSFSLQLSASACFSISLADLPSDGSSASRGAARGVCGLKSLTDWRRRPDGRD